MHFLNVPHSVESVGRLVRASWGAPPSLPSLHATYRGVLAQDRPFAPPRAGVSISYEDGSWGTYLQENRVFESIFVGRQSTTKDARRLWKEQTEQAMTYTRGTYPALGYLVDLLITDVVLLTSEATGGGSASHLPGLVAISPGPKWTTMDFAETLVHEMTHLNLFVLDAVYGLYELPTADLAEQEHRVVSAVKVGELRPLDKAFHSAVVAVPLMFMQHHRGETALVDAFAESLVDCCTGLEAKRDLFTPYGRLLLDELAEFARTLDYSLVEMAFTRTDLAA
ncbi:HEXXH motif domain-containing protein [Actinomadura sp. KC06]|uniref:aKG-HExxH-type peptide beta-hydroxylase n=1 Tax=Actinomadura sp. KC06 TaxID=2530369 RepID=UPI00104932C8|nr:HEXXH motif-containing putative peptide modification protein [Actinomadura sp. KC06]TDD39049.1 HEXXH motif domain-containing protein [Actinomadura sp. KC06]